MTPVPAGAVPAAAADVDTGAVDTGAVDTGAVDTGAVDTGAVDTGAVGAVIDQDVADAFFAALTAADEQRAVEVALDLLDGGVPAEHVLLGLVAPAQERVGSLWALGEWSVAREHAATCVQERVVAAVGAAARVRPYRDHVVLACLDGEWHALPARLVGEVLALRGFRVTFLGASVPPGHLVSYLHEHGPDVVALSCAQAVHLPAAHRTVAAARRTGTPVLAGGPGFGADGRWARAVGADAWAPDAAAAADLLVRGLVLRTDPTDAGPGATVGAGVGAGPGATVSAGVGAVSGGADPGAPRSARHLAAGDPSGAARPASGGVEYSALRDRRPELTAAVLAALDGRSPLAGVPTDPVAVRDGAELAGDPAGDVGDLLDVLGAAVHLADVDVLVGHLRWLSAVLHVRGLSTAGVATVCATVCATLHDFPTTAAHLRHGLAVLAESRGATAST